MTVHLPGNLAGSRIRVNVTYESDVLSLLYFPMMQARERFQCQLWNVCSGSESKVRGQVIRGVASGIETGIY